MNPRLAQLSESLFVLEDTCNVYLVRRGSSALLIDSGSGAVLDHLEDLGIESLEWIAHTHHHRDQCWGTPRLVAKTGARVAVPEHERYLFESAAEHWRTRRIYDAYNNTSTPFAPGEDIAVDSTLEDYEEFRWGDLSFLVLPAQGHTVGSSALLTEIDGCIVAFTGDLMTAGGRVYQLHALEQGYGELTGVALTLQSLAALERREPELILPSHGAPIRFAAEEIAALRERLLDVVRLGSELATAASLGESVAPASDYLPEPRLQQLSEHLLWSGPWACSAFYVLLSGSGEALLIDYGHGLLANMNVGTEIQSFERMRFVEHHLDELGERFGVSRVEVVVATHIHDDHVCGIPYLQRHRGVECWALDEVAEVLEDPAAWAGMPCVLPEPIEVARRAVDGETIGWRGFELIFHRAPGQTEFHSVISAEIDGRVVAFTGDNYFLEQMDVGGRRQRLPAQSTVFRNSFQLGMHRRCVEVMRAISPDLICPGHGEVLPCGEGELAAYADYVARKERAFRAVVAEPADHYLDVFWARLRPYLATVQPATAILYRLMLRNNLGREAVYEARLLPPEGCQTDPEATALRLGPGESGELELNLIAAAAPLLQRSLVSAEILIDGRSQGPVAEALLSTSPRASSVNA